MPVYCSIPEAPKNQQTLTAFQIPAEITAENLHFWQKEMGAQIQRFSNLHWEDFCQQAYENEIIIFLNPAQLIVNVITTVKIYRHSGIISAEPGDYMVLFRGTKYFIKQEAFESSYVRC